jgi:hypothetical protein
VDLKTPTDEQRAQFKEWVATRPPKVRAVAEQFDPWTVYRLRTTGQDVQVIGFDVGARSCGDEYCGPECSRIRGHEGDHDADGDVTVCIYAENPILGAISGVQVFGIDPRDLVIKEN